MKVKISKKIILVVIGSLLIMSLCGVLYLNFMCVNIEKSEELSNVKIGIIDEGLNQEHKNVILSSNQISDNYKAKTHGDKMIEFVHAVNPNIKIYYFDARDKQGKISTERVLEGLRWMENENIQYVNLSLSTKKREETLQEWLNNTELRVYSSYNNLLNSLDYPSMYENVIASGCDNSKIKYKDMDVCYANNKVIVNYNIFRTYEGNSYLSLVTLLNDLLEKF